MDNIEYLDPTTVQLKHITTILEQNQMILKMNGDLMALIVSPPAVAEMSEEEFEAYTSNMGRE